ncbi:hypothetical protein V8G54_019416 [Vigna mungo]|uniref:Uncharacterized protein n=1 Tax=Vigna mungo TaxID=3915 RepID=A0AAQ3NBS8_VIGMU
MELEDDTILDEDTTNPVETEGNREEEPLILVNALTRVANFKTMRVTGLCQKKPLHILIDSESTHNFLDIHIAKKLGCRIVNMDPLSVIVADGAKVQINTMNFEKLTMEFVVQGRRLVLRGTPNPDLKTISKQRVPNTLTLGVHILMIQLCDKGEGTLLHSLSTHAEPSNIPNSIERLLLDFEDVFNEPATLPPKRADHDHRIPLVQGTYLVNKRPYQYAKEQNDIIDGLIQ